MNEWLPLLAGPALLVFAGCRRGSARAVRTDLLAMIAAQPTAPVTDAGRAPVFAVARALQLDPGDLPALCATGRVVNDQEREAREMIRPLGLELIDVVQGDPRSASGAGGRTEMSGTRYGRHVVVRLEETSSVVHVGGDLPHFALRARAADWDGLDDAPPVVVRWLGGLEPSRRWDGVIVECGDGGLSLRRDRESTRSWMHDLWLAEQLADAARCVALAA